MNMLKQFKSVVFPAAIPPATRIDTRFSTAYQKKAAISAESVPKVIRSVTVNGSSLNFLMVKVEPLRVTSLP